MYVYVFLLCSQSHPIQYDCVSIRREKFECRYTYMEDSHVNTGAETGVMLPHSRECLGLPEAEREIFSPRLCREYFPGNFLILYF